MQGNVDMHARFAASHFLDMILHFHNLAPHNEVFIWRCRLPVVDLAVCNKQSDQTSNVGIILFNDRVFTPDPTYRNSTSLGTFAF